MVRCWRGTRWALAQLQNARFIHIYVLVFLGLFSSGFNHLWHFENKLLLCYKANIEQDSSSSASSSSSLDDDGHLTVNDSDYELIPDILQAKERPQYDQSIFFHETGCPAFFQFNRAKGSTPQPISKKNLIYLTSRQACAVESAALHNNRSQVFLTVVGPRYDSKSNPNVLVKALKHYPNIYIRTVDINLYSHDTPLHSLVTNGRLLKSRYLPSHLSDFLRYITLWRWGGLYLDLDTVTLRSMEDIPPNYVGAETDYYLSSGIMNFAHHGIGKTVAEKCLHYFRDNFSPNGWGDNGPIVITNILKSVCRTGKVFQMYDNRKLCSGFQVFNRTYFYAIEFDDWEDFFYSLPKNKTLKFLQRSYVTHFWNSASQREIISLFKDNSAYQQLAKDNCPHTYKALQDHVHYL